MQFDDDPVGGVTLVRPAIQSPDYVPGVSGWAVKIDGSAEFNDVVIRGGTVVSGEALYYTGTPGPGNLLMSLSNTATTDQYGNGVLFGFGLYDPDGSQLHMYSHNGTTIEMLPAALGGATWAPAQIYTTLGASNRPGLSLGSPSATVGGSGGRAATINLFGQGPSTTDTSMLVAADRVNVNGRLDVVGDLTAGSQAAGTAQTPAPGASPGQTSVNVSFGKTFSAVPSVQLTPNSGSTNLDAANIRWAVTNKSTTGFTISCWRDTNNATNFEWWASL